MDTKNIFESMAKVSVHSGHDCKGNNLKAQTSRFRHKQVFVFKRILCFISALLCVLGFIECIVVYCSVCFEYSAEDIDRSLVDPMIRPVRWSTTGQGLPARSLPP